MLTAPRALISTPMIESPGSGEVVGVAFRGHPVPMIGIGGEFGGLKMSGDDFEASLFDFDVNGFVQFGDWIGVQGGYRAVTIDFDADDEAGDLKLKGPYIGAILRF